MRALLLALIDDTFDMPHKENALYTRGAPGAR
jgi:hypothetical protein